ncbi:hypothetical protein H8356DRAFT_1353411 [Neocallimastix lanati (nom. inval.)]|nr:hypothetical protein H8356DRAFT_1353411 [Neocallimastix sp. JGI-2020a]
MMMLQIQILQELNLKNKVLKNVPINIPALQIAKEQNSTQILCFPSQLDPSFMTKPIPVKGIKFDIGDELNSTIYNTTLGKSLDISPTNSKKNNLIGATSNLNPSITVVNNIKHSYESNSKEVTELAILGYLWIRVVTLMLLQVGICNNRIRQVAVDYKKKRRYDC